MHSNPSRLWRALGAASVASTAALVVVAGPALAAPVSRDAPRAAADSADPSTIACPIPDGSEFIDSFGAKRSGGRRHKGVDMIAERGTPIVAVQAGDATFKQSRLGGNAVWLITESGNKFYYAHLDGFEGSSREVVAGEVIGYVGSTGNARGPHLHFETHFDGSVGNPYDATHTACTEPAYVPDPNGAELYERVRSSLRIRPGGLPLASTLVPTDRLL
ncbi:MAG: M23 family metallopeptidase [Ilumatobacter sp.]|nr:M23 family metallopeptidase [Ilumatobacter sp.]